jgi:hypothetical protein
MKFKFFISLDQSGFFHIAHFGKFYFIPVSPRFVATTALASGFIALVPFLWLRLSLVAAHAAYIGRAWQAHLKIE